MIGVGTKVRLTYMKEVTHGTTPGTPALKVLRTVGRNINPKIATLSSNETHSHGQIEDMRHGSNTVEGSIATEWSYSAQDDWLEGLLAGTWTTDVLKMGTGVTTYTVQREFLDLGIYEIDRGVAINNGAFSIRPESIVTIGFDVLGMSFGANTTVSLDASPDDAPNYAPFDSFTGTISEGGSPIACVTALDFTVARGRTLVPVIGSKYSCDVFEGTGMVTGTVSFMFQNSTLFEKWRVETESSISVSLNDIAAPTVGYDIEFPRVKYTSADKDPPREGAVIQTMGFQALYSESDGTTMIITRRPPA
jgi:hypothetical protein